MSHSIKIALISDTHNLLRPEVYPFLAEVSFILHAGDLGTEAVLQSLSSHAPTYAVRGNVDRGAWAEKLPLIYTTQVEKWRITMIHIKEEWPKYASEYPVPHILLVGHSHKPAFLMNERSLLINPGSAGRRRFKLPITMALLELAEDQLVYQLVDLEHGGKVMETHTLSYWEV
ncbi:MAG: metallophosphoesterase family protein [Bacteroidota bacterium]